MKTFLTAFLAISSLFVALSAKAQDLQFNEYKKFLMNGNQGNKKMAIQTTCTATSGKVTRVGEPGYDLCLAELRNQQEQRKMGAPTETKTAPTAGTGATIQFGN